MAEAATSGRYTMSSRTAIHLLCTAFYMAASSSAMWQYGNPMLAHLLLAAALATGLSIFVSKKILDDLARKILQIFILGLAIIWLIYRASNHVSVEKYLIEFLCIIGLSFGLTLNIKDYGIQCIISLIVFISGSVFPRNAFIYFLPLVLLTGISLAYVSRLIPLSGDKTIRFSLRPLRQNWSYFAIHLLLIVSFWFYFSTFFPTPVKTGAGFISTSFVSENVNYLPPEYSGWFNSEMRRSSDTGDLSKMSTGKASSSGKDGQISENSSSDDSVDGDGSGRGVAGRDLVFRVNCPVKLYWLGSLYDVYDGHKWNASQEMKKQKIKGRFEECSGSSIIQSFSIVKMYSSVLYGAYLPKFYEFPPFKAPSTDRTFYNCRLTNPESVELPFSYTVISSNFNNETATEGFKPEMLWYDKLKKQHYLDLPKDKISPRLKELASKTAMDGKDSYSKAILLRDYLRSNFKYRMDAANVPEDREIADYFIFEMKEGNCQHFATSLVVLARIAGIPSRLALGFSPGNYNALNGVFEVHEYHAHAWAQLFIEGKGWLTFDGTPPGQVISNTSPLILGSFKDPFGDEWRVRPPELTSHTKSYMNKSTRSSISFSDKDKEIPQPNILQKIAVNIPVSEAELKSTISKISGKDPNDVNSNRKGLMEKIRNILSDLKHNASVMADLFLGGVKKFLFWLFGLQGLSIMLLLLLAYAFYRAVLNIRSHLRRRRRIRKCLGIIERFHSFSEKHPAENINICFRITRELLDVSGLTREHNMELFNYGASLERIDYNLSKDVLVVFFLYSKMEYGTSEPSREDVETAFQRIIRIRNNLRNNLNLI